MRIEFLIKGDAAGSNAAAKRAATGDYLENGRISEKQQQKGLKPETKFRPE